MNAQPSPWIARFAPLIPEGGDVLDLACGGGRHARLLAGMGYQVEAVDRDADALATLADTFKDTPPQLKIAVQGVARMSQTLGNRDAALRSRPCR